MADPDYNFYRIDDVLLRAGGIVAFVVIVLLATGQIDLRLENPILYAAMLAPLALLWIGFGAPVIFLAGGFDTGVGPIRHSLFGRLDVFDLDICPKLNDWGVTALCAAGIVSLMAPPSAGAHGLVSAKADRLHRQVEANAGDLGLRLEYAATLINIQHFAQAREQLDIIRRHDADNRFVEWLAARNEFDATNYAEAIRHVDRHLAVSPTDYRALELKGRALTKLERHDLAAQAFSAALRTGRATVDTFVYAGEARAAAGDIDTAVATLVEGVDRIGALPLFYLKLAALEADRDNHVAAAAHMSEMLARLGHDQRREGYLATRGDYWWAGGRHEAARRDYRQARELLLSRSQIIRRTPAAQDLLRTLDERLSSRN